MRRLVHPFAVEGTIFRDANLQQVGEIACKSKSENSPAKQNDGPPCIRLLALRGVRRLWGNAVAAGLVVPWQVKKSAEQDKKERLRSLILPCFFNGLKKDPLRALRLLGSTNVFKKKAWRRFSLQIFGMQFVADAYAAAHEAGIRPFLTYGTLLGCVREGRILPQDNDIDIGILHTDYAKKYAFFAAMRRRGYLVEHDIAYTYRFVRPDYDLYMDVDVLYPWRDKMVCSRFVDGQYQEAAIFPAHAFDELKPARLGDLQVLVPAQAELVLDSIYRDWRVDLKAKDPSCYVNILPALMVDPDLAVPAFALMDAYSAIV